MVCGVPLNVILFLVVNPVPDTETVRMLLLNDIEMIDHGEEPLPPVGVPVPFIATVAETVPVMDRVVDSARADPVGANWNVIWQVAEAAKVDPQSVLTCVKFGPSPVPGIEKLRLDCVAVPVFWMVSTAVAVEPTAVLAKRSGRGERVRAGAVAAPVPVIAALPDAPLEAPLTRSRAERAPAVVGVKVRFAPQVALTASVDPQVMEDSAKSPGLAPPKDSAVVAKVWSPVPVLRTVTARPPDDVPTLMLPKVRAGVTVMAGKVPVPLNVALASGALLFIVTPPVSVPLVLGVKAKDRAQVALGARDCPPLQSVPRTLARPKSAGLDPPVSRNGVAARMALAVPVLRMVKDTGDPVDPRSWLPNALLVGVMVMNGLVGAMAVPLRVAVPDMLVVLWTVSVPEKLPAVVGVKIRVRLQCAPGAKGRFWAQLPAV